MEAEDNNENASSRLNNKDINSERQLKAAMSLKSQTSNASAALK